MCNYPFVSLNYESGRFSNKVTSFYRYSRPSDKPITRAQEKKLTMLLHALNKPDLKTVSTNHVRASRQKNARVARTERAGSKISKCRATKF